jgi:hypothetical protein
MDYENITVTLVVDKIVYATIVISRLAACEKSEIFRKLVAKKCAYYNRPINYYFNIIFT